MKHLKIGFTLLIFILGIAIIWHSNNTINSIRVNDTLNRSLIKAVKERNVNSVQELLDRGANPNARDLPPIKISGFSDWLNLLLNRNAVHFTAPPAICIAAKLKMIVTYKFSDSDPFFIQANNNYMKQCQKENQESINVCNLLISKGADVNMYDGNGDTPLILTSRFDSASHVTAFLLDKRASINTVNNNGESALYNAVTNSNAITARLLLKHGGNIQVPKGSRYCQTLLASLLISIRDIGGIKNESKANLHEVFKLLIDRGDNINERETNGDTLLHLAANVDDPYFLKTLINLGLNVNTPNIEGTTPLMNALCFPANVNLLISCGADVNAKYKGGTVLDYGSSCYPNSTIPNVVINTLHKRGAKSIFSKSRIY